MKHIYIRAIKYNPKKLILSLEAKNIYANFLSRDKN